MKALIKRYKEEGAEGFTLIELLIVIVILGILSTVVVFAVQGITNKGQGNSCKADKNTLVIVTADHAHSSQIVDGPTPGLGTTLTTVEQAPLRISYGTSAEGGSQQHTGSQLRIAAYGPSAIGVLGLTDQTDTFFTIANALKLNTGVKVSWPLPKGPQATKPWDTRRAG